MVWLRLVLTQRPKATRKRPIRFFFFTGESRPCTRTSTGASNGQPVVSLGSAERKEEIGGEGTGEQCKGVKNGGELAKPRLTSSFPAQISTHCQQTSDENNGNHRHGIWTRRTVKFSELTLHRQYGNQ